MGLAGVSLGRELRALALSRLWPGFFSSSPTDFLFYFSRARVDIFLLFFFHQTYILLDFEPACSQVTHEP